MKYSALSGGEVLGDMIFTVSKDNSPCVIINHVRVDACRCWKIDRLIGGWVDGWKNMNGQMDGCIDQWRDG